MSEDITSSASNSTVSTNPLAKDLSEDEKRAAYHCALDKNSRMLTRVENLARQDIKTVEEDICQAKKSVQQKVAILKEVYSKKEVICTKRRELEAIEASYAGCIMSDKLDASPTLESLMALQEMLSLDVMTLTSSTDVSRSRGSTCSHSEDDQIRSANVTLTGAQKIKEGGEEVVKVTIASGGPKEIERSSQEHRSEHLSAAVYRAKMEKLQNEVVLLKDQLDSVLSTVMPLPKRDEGQPLWPETEFIKKKHMQLLEKDQKYDDEMMSIAIQAILSEYNTRPESSTARTFTLIPTEVMQYFLQGARLNPGEQPIDVVKFLQQNYDIFAFQDLYMTLSVDGQQCVAVVRNVAKAIERRRECIEKSTDSVNDGSKRCRTLVEKLQRAFTEQSVIIFFDACSTSTKDEVDKVQKRHTFMASKVKEYLLAEAQINYGRRAFQSITDIDLQVMTAKIPREEAQFGKNNSGPFALRCFQLYLDDTERCCQEVLPLEKRSDPFWQVESRGSIREGLKALICTEYGSDEEDEEEDNSSTDDQEQTAGDVFEQIRMYGVMHTAKRSRGADGSRDRAGTTSRGRKKSRVH